MGLGAWHDCGSQALGAVGRGKFFKHVREIKSVVKFVSSSSSCQNGKDGVNDTKAKQSWSGSTFLLVFARFILLLFFLQQITMQHCM
jgi:hypothetical protein